MIDLDLKTTGMEYASEMVVRATLNKLRITEVPTTLKKDGRSHPPHLRSWHDGWRHLKFLLMYSPRWLFLYPGLTLIALGLLGVVLISLGSIKIGQASFDLNTMLYSAMSIIIGLQVTYFALFTRAYGDKSRHATCK